MTSKINLIGHILLNKPLYKVSALKPTAVRLSFPCTFIRDKQKCLFWSTPVKTCVCFECQDSKHMRASWCHCINLKKKKKKLYSLYINLISLSFVWAFQTYNMESCSVNIWRTYHFVYVFINGRNNLRAVVTPAVDIGMLQSILVSIDLSFF